MPPLREYRWKKIGTEDLADNSGTASPADIQKLADELTIPASLARILTRRGIDTFEKARQYFRPTLEDLHDPFLMDGMDVAVNRIKAALASNEIISVYGDYDVDGTNGTALLWTFLRSVGARAHYYIPERLKEGYGISTLGIDRVIDSGASLMVAVDCGITAVDQVAYARGHNLDVIICDHHEPGEILPDAVAILNPLKPGCGYPFKYLSGCGVAFKLVHALSKDESIQTFLGGSSMENLASFLDFVALATTADIVPLVGENRTLVKLGLELINTQPRPGIRALIDSSGMRLGKITSGNVVFVIAPRINAVGRLGDARRAVELLASDSYQQALEFAKVFEEENRQRRKLDEETFEQARTLVEQTHDLSSDRAIVLHKGDWHSGVVGIVASRLVDWYYRPTVLMTSVDGVAKGSARSIPGFDIYQALLACRGTIEQFGGHKYAAGLTVQLDHLDAFRHQFSEVARASIPSDLLTPAITIDEEINLSDLTPKFLRLLHQCAPFGPGNMRPVFVIREAELQGVPRIVGKNHLRFKVQQSGRVVDAIAFNMGDYLGRLSNNGNRIHLAFSIDEGEFAGEVVPQLKIRDLKFGDE